MTRDSGPTCCSGVWSTVRILTAGTLEGPLGEVSRLTIDDVKAHHARHFAADNAFVAVGDFEGRRLRAGAGAFWKLGDAGSALSPLPKAVFDVRPRLRRVAHPAEQVQVVLGHLGIPAIIPPSRCLPSSTTSWAGPGFTDRLSRVVRDELGLAYAIGGGMTYFGRHPAGLFRISVGTGPDEVEQVVAAVLEQILRDAPGGFLGRGS